MCNDISRYTEASKPSEREDVQESETFSRSSTKRAVKIRSVSCQWQKGNMMLPLTLKTARVLEEAFEQQRERLKLERLDKVKNKNV